MAKVKVSLGAVVRDVHLAVLEWAHRARVDVDVRVEFDQGDLEPPGFESRGECGGGEPFPERRYNAAGNEN